ncbi:hypothetical protein QWA_17535 [Alcaligenes faecalis subsp. faecalis NCIB 8687]|nr:hypothetical protein QWA_17535 [Alcaligenes faecalis subsp. faecalis NCIB 8687]
MQAWILGLKITLALSVFGHFLTVMVMSRRKTMTARRSRIIHLSVLCPAVLIVLLPGIGLRWAGYCLCG